MSTVELSFSALPVHVRTARLIVTAVARRSGVAEHLLDEVRLAVGEACSRAVEAHRRHCPDEPVRLELRGADRRFEVTVSDTVPAEDGAGGLSGASDAEKFEHGFAGEGAAELGLAVIAGLADDVEIASTPKGVQIRMSWPAEAEATI
ncbi:anti-sigma regulatory factor (Ser/Thr protein kinase) [Actinomadura hallensis]|uniref:Anti-sigma regulatory factor (Ser/Thr protein kinase) n=1 Tax=Actinomadura hallensis TaxID=337895 RepID=A0A543INC9_9ACTN|nr:ATP-binding protein [Actinomadura hallensis]TQM72095.1 anti-sigma regulatory factor (Ser/Thr protein kinase) [Actinomadura hallensis]HLV72984.1 ATP-binding protein [Vulgatibacteraceae bacterium]